MFKAWCKQNRYNNNTKLSHVLMDGGVLSIPFDRLNDFYQIYIKSVLAGEKLYVVEQKTEPFNFFVDLDYKDAEPLMVDQIESIVKIICDKVETFSENSRALISIAKPKEKDGQMKSGVHINWENFTIDCENANYLMKHIISILSKIYSQKEWVSIIDPSVYGDPSKNTQGSGFRIPWSYKKGKHAFCKGKGCVECDNTGKITEGMYLPVFMYENKKLSKIDQEPTLEKLWIATVRTNKTLEDVIKIPFIGEPLPPSQKQSQPNLKNSIQDPVLVAYIQTFIRQNLEGQQNSRVLGISKTKKKDMYAVQTDSKFCENLRRNHSSNHVWFVIDDGRIAQKCFCTCETDEGRKKGMCKNHTGRPHMINKKIEDILYPNKKLSNNRKLALCPSLSLY